MGISNPKEYFRRSAMEKVRPQKTFFSGQMFFLAKQFFKDYLFRSIFLCSFRSEISINLVILKKNKVLSYSRRDSCTFFIQESYKSRMQCRKLILTGKYEIIKARAEK
jgi:hypothetical protein